MQRMTIAVTVGSILTVLASLGTGPAHHADSEPLAVLNKYLSFVQHPDPKPIEAEVFAPDTEAFWSNGEMYRGREAVLKAIERSRGELVTSFHSVKFHLEKVNVRKERGFAWLTCRIQSEGVLKEDNAPFKRAVRSTFVLDKRDGRWQIVHEHSSKLPDAGE